ncbi:MAG: adenosylmethionine--8-amino-7-oxononanoate transaminase [Candidatus Omnitrophota bacterium]|nr:adenosylmethionine--8-amino-7-oxononanoate transaminase [Candidatus Omnitrophota bacterium]
MNNWVKKDLKYIWHPYTQMKDCLKAPPILIEKAKGIKLFDTKGNFYYDTISSWWCNVHGHNHSQINAGIKKQLALIEHILFAGFTHKPAICLAQEIISLAPHNLSKVFFSDNGSTSVEAALKMSFQYWQNIGYKEKRKFISLDMGYHGDTIGAMSVSGIGLFNKVFSELMFESFKICSPYCYRCPRQKMRSSCSIDCIKALEQLLEKKSLQIAGIILEPMILAAGGMIVYPKEYLLKAGELAKKFDVHLIIDEVATGFGRTGKMFASEFVDIKPDFLCLSKGLTAGYLPLGLTLTTDKIYDAFCADYEEGKTFYHGHTYTANPIACAAALESLKVFKKEKTLEKIKEIIPLFHSRLEEFRQLDFVGDLRYIGLIGALELVEDKVTKERIASSRRLGYEVYKQGLKKNIVLRPLGDIIYLFLPLCIKKKELFDILDRVRVVIKSLFRGIGKYKVLS